MKLKFMLVPLAVFGLAVGSYAGDVTWVTPSNKVCLANGGQISKEGICRADSINSKNICRALGTRLPTIYELRKVVTGCGGVIDKYDENKANSSYISCFTRKGFISSTPLTN